MLHTQIMAAVNAGCLVALSGQQRRLFSASLDFGQSPRFHG